MAKNLIRLCVVLAVLVQGCKWTGGSAKPTPTVTPVVVAPTAPPPPEATATVVPTEPPASPIPTSPRPTAAPPAPTATAACEPCSGKCPGWVLVTAAPNIYIYENTITGERKACAVAEAEEPRNAMGKLYKASRTTLAPFGCPCAPPILDEACACRAPCGSWTYHVTQSAEPNYWTSEKDGDLKVRCN